MQHLTPTPVSRPRGPFAAGRVRIIPGDTPAAPKLIVEDLGDRYSVRVYGCLGYEIGGQAFVRSLDPDSTAAQWAAMGLQVTAGVSRRQTLRALGRLYAEQVAADVIAGVAA